METKKLFAAVLATAVCFGSALLPFGKTQHSTAFQTVFAAEKAEEKVNTLIGDVNGDSIIDSSDASDILIEYSSSLTGQTSTMTANQKKLADLNFDGVIDSSDASLVLMYYAHVATGGKLSIEDFLYSLSKPPVVTTTTASTKKTVQTTTTTTTRVTRTTAKISSKTTSSKTTAKTTAKTKPKTTTKTTVKTKPSTTVSTATVSTKTTASTTKKPVTNASTKPPITTAATKPPVTTTTTDVVRVTSIGVTRSELSVNVGEGALSAYVTMFPVDAPNKGEIWTSSDESVATVNSEGWVTGIGEGECTITVKSADNPEVSADIKVTVINTRNVKDIRLSRTTMTLQVGYGDLAARVTMLPETAVNKAEIWTSSQPDIAEVDGEGWVTAKKAGNTVITVQSVDNPAVFAFVLVTVVDTQTTQPVVTPTETTTTASSTSPVTTTTSAVTEAVKEIQVSDTEINLTVGEQKETVVKVLPENAANKALNWTSSNNKVASVDQFGKITAVGAGNCIITVNSVENAEIKANILVNVKNAGEVKEILLSKYEITVAVGQSDISWVTMLPSTASNKDEIWTTSDPSIATVDKYGWVKGESVGECTVTVFSADSPSVKAEIAVKVVNGPVEPPTVNFSCIVPGKSTDKAIAFKLPFPENANGRYIVDYIITDKNGKITTISTPTLVVPVVKSAITMLTAETNEFTAEAYITDLNTSQSAKIGKYSFSLSPRDAKIETEDIYYAFYVLGGITE